FSLVLFLARHQAHLDLLSFPTRRSSDLWPHSGRRPGRSGRGGRGGRHGSADRPPRAGVAPVGGSAGAPGGYGRLRAPPAAPAARDRKSTRLNSSHVKISYAVFCLKKKKS